MQKTEANNLTPRESEVLNLVAEGFSNKEIGCRLYISIDTVKNHLKNIYRKLGAGNRIEALQKMKGRHSIKI